MSEDYKEQVSNFKYLVMYLDCILNSVVLIKVLNKKQNRFSGFVLPNNTNS